MCFATSHVNAHSNYAISPFFLRSSIKLAGVRPMASILHRAFGAWSSAALVNGMPLEIRLPQPASPRACYGPLESIRAVTSGA